MKAQYAWENYQRATIAFLSILLTLLAFLCLIIVGGVPNWTRIALKDPNRVAEDGHITFGLFRGEYKIDSGFSSIGRGDDFEVGKFLGETLPVWRLDLTFALVVVAFVACLPAMFFTFLSTYQTVTTVWKGPVVAYLFNLLAAFFAFFAVGVYIDFFVWDVGDGHSVLRAQRFDLTRRVFITEATLRWCFILHCVACGLLFASLLLCWRLIVILPSFAGPVSVFKSEESLTGQDDYQHTQVQQMEFQQSIQTNTLPISVSFQQRPSVTSYEESSVLY